MATQSQSSRNAARIGTTLVLGAVLTLVGFALVPNASAQAPPGGSNCNGLVDKNCHYWAGTGVSEFCGIWVAGVCIYGATSPVLK